MDSNGPQSPALPDVRFRTHKDDRAQPATHKASFAWLVWLIVIGIVGIAIWYFYFHAKSTGAATGQATGRGTGGREVPVVAVPAREGDLPLYLNGLGTVTPFNLVNVRSRVDGQIMEIDFKEGQDVKQGDLLFQIDPRPYEVQLEQAQGQLGRDEALLENAKQDLARYQSAGASVAKQQIDLAQAQVRQYEATVKSDDAGINSAKLNLVYCKITAPITGRIGLRKVDIGNMVAANDTNGLAVITQLQPIAVVFSISQDDAEPVLRKPNGGIGLQVTAFDSGLIHELATGEVSAIDNQIDPTTGTIRIKASFENKDHTLFPNQFVNARLLVDTLKGVTIIPAAGVQHGPEGKEFCYVVKKDQTVEVRDVTVGPTTDIRTNSTTDEETAITEGIRPGEVVVTDGVDKLQPGAKVKVGERGVRGATSQPRGAASQPHGATTRPHGMSPRADAGL